LSGFNDKLIFLDRFSENSQISNLIKIVPVAVELIDADEWTGGQTDNTKLLVAFRNFANAPKNHAAR
jgi:hypothetical protein